jgi:hypothetical protein
LFVGKELIFSIPLEIHPLMVYYFVDHIRT